MRFYSYFNTAVTLIRQYDGSIPLHHYLKNYFSQHKKYGSKDRKHISHACYCFYRLGHALKGLVIEEKLKVALFICNEEKAEWHILFDMPWIGHPGKTMNERIAFIQQQYPGFSMQSVFPCQGELSETIDATALAASYLIQPDLFLRIRPNQEKTVEEKLKTNGVTFQEISPTCLSLSNASKIDAILELDAEVVIQDYSSQQIASFLQLITYNSQPITKLWDCCAASGGKSILAYDVLKNIELTVSDVRFSILQNLKQRFQRAGINYYKSFVTDLTNPVFSIQHLPAGRQGSTFDIIICDAPCSGSGTWGRTPEQLAFFVGDKIAEYSNLQKKIVGNLFPYLAKDGYFLYITCSVFKKENEEVARFIQEKFHLQLIKMELLKGYNQKADSMFAALFKTG